MRIIRKILSHGFLFRITEYYFDFIDGATNAAMLLFSKDPEKWQLGAYVKIVELVYLKYMKAKITYEGMQRIERYFVPEAALREALLNAL